MKKPMSKPMMNLKNMVMGDMPKAMPPKGKAKPKKGKKK